MKSVAIKGSMWTLGGYGASQVLRLGSSIVLARLLFPEAFGIMALVSVFMQGLVMFSDVGIGPSIIHNERGDDPDFLNTAWTIQTIRGTALWLIACIGAYPFSLLYGEPQLAWLVPVAGLTALIAGFNSTSLATTTRHIQVSKITLLEIICQAGALLTTVTTAWIYKSVWALVCGGLASSLIKLVLSHTWLRTTANRFRWDASAAGALLTFGKWIFLSTLLSFCVLQADKLIFGQLIPLSLLGVYSIAAALAAVPRSVIIRLGTAIVFPAYSAKYRATGSLHTVFNRVRHPLIVFAGLGTSGLALLAPTIIGLLYDARYADAAWMLQILSFSVWWHILECTSSSALLAMGKPNLIALGSFAKLVAMIVFITLGYHQFGFPGAVAGYALSETCRYASAALMISRYGYPVWKLDMAATAAWGGCVAGGLLLSQYVVDTTGWQFANVVVDASLLILCWGFVYAFLRHDEQSALSALKRPVQASLLSSTHPRP